MSNTDQSVFPRVPRDEMPEFMQAYWDISMRRRGEANFIESSVLSYDANSGGALYDTG